MSFFKDFKDDLSQALNELLPEDVEAEEDTEEQIVNTLDADTLDETSENEKMKEWLEEFAMEDGRVSDPGRMDADQAEDTTEDLKDETEDTAEEPKDGTEADTEGSGAEDMEEDIPTEPAQDEEEGSSDILHEEPGDEDASDLSNIDMDELEDISADISSEEIMGEEGEEMDENIDLELLNELSMEDEEKAEEITEKAPSKLRATSVANDDEVSVISKGTTINGSISSEGSLDVMGIVVGDIECLGKLSITGKITGNSTAAEVYVNTERMEGSINSEGSVKVGLGTVVIGDIVATSGVIAGAVKGEIDVNGPIVIDSTAIIKGNIKAKSVQINNGAVVEGFVSLSYSSIDVDNVFE